MKKYYILIGLVSIIGLIFLFLIEKLSNHGWSGVYYVATNSLISTQPRRKNKTTYTSSNKSILLSDTTGYNEKCSAQALMVIGKNDHAKYLENTQNSSIGEADRFLKYKYWFENFYHDYIYRHANKEYGLYKGYKNFENEYLNINNFLILKLLPPHMTFNQMGYHNLTMGSLGIIPDITDDGTPELIAQTAHDECSPNRIDLIVSGDRIKQHLNESNENRLSLQRVSTNLNFYSPTSSKYNDPPSVNSYRSSKKCKVILHRGDSLRLKEDLTAMIKIEGVKPVPPNAVIRDDEIMFISSNGSGETNLEKINCMNGKISQHNIWKTHEQYSIFIDHDKYGYSFSNDIDGDGKDEFTIYSKTFLHIITSRTKHLYTIHLPNSFEGYTLGRITGFGGKIRLNRKDKSTALLNTVTFHNAHKNDKAHGVVFLIDVSLLHKSGHNFEDLIYSSFIGTQTHVMNSSSNGIGYSLSPSSADFDSDGLDDFVTVTHYEGAFNGALYIMSGANIEEGSIIRTSNPMVLKIRGIPNSFLGTGLDFTFDWDSDGINDIVVGADVDHEAGLGAGAIYILSGKSIGRHLLQSDDQIN